MKLSELRPCDCCGGPLTGGIFHILRQSMAIVSPKAANQVLGMTQYFGGLQHIGLAEMMSPDPEAVKILGDEKQHGGEWLEIFVCQECSLKDVMLGVLIEKASEAKRRIKESTRKAGAH